MDAPQQGAAPRELPPEQLPLPHAQRQKQQRQPHVGLSPSSVARGCQEAAPAVHGGRQAEAAPGWQQQDERTMPLSPPLRPSSLQEADEKDDSRQCAEQRPVGEGSNTSEGRRHEHLALCFVEDSAPRGAEEEEHEDEEEAAFVCRLVVRGSFLTLVPQDAPMPRPRSYSAP